MASSRVLRSHTRAAKQHVMDVAPRTTPEQLARSIVSMFRGDLIVEVPDLPHCVFCYGTDGPLETPMCDCRGPLMRVHDACQQRAIALHMARRYETALEANPFAKITVKYVCARCDARVGLAPVYESRRTAYGRIARRAPVDVAIYAFLYLFFMLLPYVLGTSVLHGAPLCWDATTAKVLVVRSALHLAFSRLIDALATAPAVSTRLAVKSAALIMALTTWAFYAEQAYFPYGREEPYTWYESAKSFALWVGAWVAPLAAFAACAALVLAVVAADRGARKLVRWERAN